MVLENDGKGRESIDVCVFLESLSTYLPPSLSLSYFVPWGVGEGGEREERTCKRVVGWDWPNE